MPGKLLIFSAPSGSGKTTVVRHLLDHFTDLEFSVSACSRSRRDGEIHGRDYYFLSVDEFRKKIEAEEFVEWEEVYPGHYYGTLKSELERIWAKGHHVVFDVDVVGGLNLKKKFGEQALAVFIKAPSLEVLEKRLRDRSTDDEASIRKRIKKASLEMKSAPEFDRIIVNDTLEHTLKTAEELVNSFLST